MFHVSRFCGILFHPKPVRKPAERLPDGNLRIHVDFAFRRFSDRKRIVEPTRETTEEERTVIGTIGRVLDWADSLASGVYESVIDLSRATGMDNSYLTRLLHLPYLAPDILQAVVEGTYPGNVSLEKLRSITTPIWSEQHEQLGLP